MSTTNTNHDCCPPPSQAIILNPTPSISVSIGAYPSLLPAYAQGSATRRVATRNAIVQDEWRGLVAKRADETVAELTKGARGISDLAQSSKDAVKGVARGAGQVRELAGRVEDSAVDRREIDEALRENEQHQGHASAQWTPEDYRLGENFPWYHDGFDMS